MIDHKVHQLKNFSFLKNFIFNRLNYLPASRWRLFVNITKKITNRINRIIYSIVFNRDGHTIWSYYFFFCLTLSLIEWLGSYTVVDIIVKKVICSNILSFSFSPISNNKRERKFNLVQEKKESNDRFIIGISILKQKDERNSWYSEFKVDNVFGIL
jgi:hypothetical protein